MLRFRFIIFLVLLLPNTSIAQDASSETPQTITNLLNEAIVYKQIDESEVKSLPSVVGGIKLIGDGGGGETGGDLGPSSEDIFTRLASDFTTSPHTTDLLGDSVDINNGNVNFSHTDLVANGIGPSIVVSRKLQGNAYSPFKHSNLGDWSLDLPSIQTSLLKSTSRYSGAWGLGLACSGEISPGPLYNLGTTYLEHEYWNGDNLILPGQGREPLLENSTGYLANKTTFRRVTKSNWKFSCISVSGVGEGFLGYSPDGLIYTFSKYRLLQGELLGSTPRYNAFMLVTKVEDRFGNVVNYNYTGNNITSITASDGRTVTFTYGVGSEVNFIKTASYNGRTWTYTYNPNGSLTQVLRPDGLSWYYNISKYPNTNMTAWNGKLCVVDKPFVADFSGTITHPNGVVGTFTFSGQKHGRSNVTQTRLKANIAEFVTCHEYVNYALKSKTLSGPGLTNRTWGYQYSGNAGTWTTTTPTATHLLSGSRPPSIDALNHKSTTVTAPDGSKSVYFYNRDYTSHKESSLMAIDEYDVNGTTLLSRAEYTLVASGSLGFTGTMHENNRPNIIRANTSSTKVSRSTDVYTTGYSVFDIYGYSEVAAESNTFNGKTRFTKQTYLHDTTNWLIGLPRQTYVSATSTYSATPTSEVTYYSATGTYKSLPDSFNSFGRLYKRNESYHITTGQNGLLKRVSYNGASHNTASRWVEYSNYKRGIAQAIQTPQSLSTTVQTATKIVDNNGWVTKQTDFLNQCVNYGYDNLGRMTLIAPCDTPWLSTNVLYTNAGISEGLSFVSSGMLKQTITKGNYQKITYFDGLLRPIMTKESDTSLATTARYNRNGYDAFNRPTYQSLPNVSSTTPYGIVTTYDGLGRVKTVDNNTTVGEVTYSYLTNNRIQVNDNRTNVTTTTYLAYGAPEQSMPTSIASPEGVTTTSVYNINDNVTSISQGGQTEFRAYDSYQQLCRVNRNDVGRTAYQFNAIGQLLWQATGASVSTTNTDCDTVVDAVDKATFAYDNLGNTKSILFGDNSANRSFVYDANSQLKTLTAGAVVTAYEYNPLGLLEKETLSVDGKTCCSIMCTTAPATSPILFIQVARI